MPSPTGMIQITGGGFRDFEGNVLNAGYLLVELSHDEAETAIPAQIVGGVKQRITLNSSGNIPSLPATYLYNNANLTPANSYYIVRAFRSDGVEAWASQQFWTFNNLMADPFDVGALPPSHPPGGGLQGGAFTLQTNGVVNGLQTLLNLQQGSNITLTDNGSGQVTVAAAGGTVPTNGYFAGPGLMWPTIGMPAVNRSIVPAAANAVICTLFSLPTSATVQKITWSFLTGFASSSAAFGIYSENGGTKLIDSGALSTVSPGVVVATITPVTLQANTMYWFAQTCSSINPAGVSVDAAISVSQVYAMFSNSTPRYGRAAHDSASGVLPATLGTVTAITTVGNSCGIAIPLFEV